MSEDKKLKNQESFEDEYLDDYSHNYSHNSESNNDQNQEQIHYVPIKEDEVVEPISDKKKPKRSYPVFILFSIILLSGIFYFGNDFFQSNFPIEEELSEKEKISKEPYGKVGIVQYIDNSTIELNVLGRVEKHSYDFKLNEEINIDDKVRIELIEKEIFRITKLS